MNINPVPIFPIFYGGGFSCFVLFTTAVTLFASGLSCRIGGKNANNDVRATQHEAGAVAVRRLREHLTSNLDNISLQFVKYPTDPPTPRTSLRGGE
jgi:hypothetical protein